MKHPSVHMFASHSATDILVESGELKEVTSEPKAIIRLSVFGRLSTNRIGFSSGPVVAVCFPSSVRSTRLSCTSG